MKIEKLNENQIRCILSRSDLEQRKLRLSELARGSAKAKSLFQDMMQQAYAELGFEVDNIPLMIEAIPVSGDCLILVVTKVDDPDELDERFPDFSGVFSIQGEPGEGEFSEMPDDIEDELEETDDFQEMMEEDGDMDSLEEAEDFSPEEDPKAGASAPFSDPFDLLGNFTEAIAQAKKELLKQKKKDHAPLITSQIYQFSCLDDIISLSGFVAPFFEGRSDLYKDPADGLYYLILHQNDASRDAYDRACIIASDYGHQIAAGYGTMSYFKEHFTTILKETALEQLHHLNG